MPARTRSVFNSRLVGRLALVVILATVGSYIYIRFGDYFQLDYLAAREAELRHLHAVRPLMVYGFAFLIYVSVTALSLPFAAVLSLAYGWCFGFLPGVLLVSFASTMGATIAFLLSRFLFRDAIQTRFGDRLQRFNAALEREGPFYLFTLRLIPAVPFFVINAVMGLTPLRTRTFWWVSQLGMLPGTFVFLYAGSRVPTLQTLAERGAQAILTPQVLLAFGLLGIFPWLLRRGLQWLRTFSKIPPAADPPATDG